MGKDDLITVQSSFGMRLAGPEDLAAIVALTQAAYAPYSAILDAPPIPVTEDYAPRIAQGQVWLLEIGDELAGVITLERHEDHAMIFSVAVSPAFQGKGFGIALLKHADEQARQWGLPEIRLYTNAKNGTKHRALSRLRLSRNGSPAQSLPARVDTRRHGQTRRQQVHHGLIATRNLGGRQ